MYSVIHQVCPNRCLAACVRSGDPDSGCTSCTNTIHCSFFLHTLGLYTAPVACSLSPTLHVHHQSAVYISSATTFNFVFFEFFSHSFHFETCNKKLKILLDTDKIRWTFVHIVESSWWLPRSFFLEFPCSCLGCPFLHSFTNHVSFWQFPDRRGSSDLSGQALPLRWGGTSHLVTPIEAQFAAAGIKSQKPR